MDFDDSEFTKTMVDARCYNVKDIVDYLQKQYAGRQDVPLKELWNQLDEHPVFPSDGYRREIKSGLKKYYGARELQTTISFLNR